MKSIEIHLDGNVDDTLKSLEYLIERLSPLPTLSNDDCALLDMSKVHYIGPDGIVLITGSVAEARRRNINVRVTTPAAPPAVGAFLEFSGFNHWMSGTPMPQQDHPGNVTIPLRQYKQSHHADPEPIRDLISRFEPVSEDLQVSLGVAVTECIQNVEDHAQSPIGAVGCARFMRRKREVRVALIDWGRGILNSLQPRYPVIQNAEEALRRVLHGGYSAKTRMNNQGRGIDNLRAVTTEAFGGDLFIISGNAAVEIRGRSQPRYHTLRCSFQGTAVCFSLPVHPRN